MKIVISWKTRDYYVSECLNSYEFSLLEIIKAYKFYKLRKTYGKTNIKIGI